MRIDCEYREAVYGCGGLKNGRLPEGHRSYSEDHVKRLTFSLGSSLTPDDTGISRSVKVPDPAGIGVKPSGCYPFRITRIPHRWHSTVSTPSSVLNSKDFWMTRKRCNPSQHRNLPSSVAGSGTISVSYCESQVLTALASRFSPMECPRAAVCTRSSTSIVLSA